MNLEQSQIAIARIIKADIKIIDVLLELQLLEVQVPAAFLGTGGFSARREGRYSLSLHFTIAFCDPVHRRYFIAYAITLHDR